MAKEDCIFIVAFWLGNVMVFVFIGGFATQEWTHHSTGRVGLWSECKKNISVEQKVEEEKCSSSSMAEGPAFLDAARTLACFSLVFYAVGIYGFICSDHAEGKNACQQHLQEIGYILAGIFAVITGVVYGLHYYDHYSEKYYHPSLDAAFYLVVIAGGLSIFSGILMWYSRDIKSSGKNDKKPVVQWKNNEGKKKADQRKDWLMNKNVPTPSQQKDKKLILSTRTEKKVEETVEVKSGFTNKIIAPTMVILAMKRLKKGQKRPTDDEESPVLVSPPTPPPEVHPDRYKGIFTVEVNKKEDQPDMKPRVVPVPVPTIQRKASIASTSSDTSATSSDISVVQETSGGVTIAANAQSKASKAKGSDSLQRPPKPRRHFSQNEAYLRANAEKSAVVVTDDDSLRIAERPSRLQRHMTQQEASLRPAVMTHSEESTGAINIYTIPPEPGAAPTTGPPAYDIIGTEDGHKSIPKHAKKW